MAPAMPFPLLQCWHLSKISSEYLTHEDMAEAGQFSSEPNKVLISGLRCEVDRSLEIIKETLSRS